MPKYQTLPEMYRDDCASIDPGAQACAVAVSTAPGNVLHWVGVIAAFDRHVRCFGCKRVIVERPEANGRDTPPDDLIAITAAGFFLAGLIAGGPVRAVTPREWKGQTPKPVHHRRLWAALSAAERALLGGDPTLAAIQAACKRGASGRWSLAGARYYRASELPSVGGVRITHDILDAAALNLYDSGRLPGP